MFLYQKDWKTSSQSVIKDTRKQKIEGKINIIINILKSIVVKNMEFLGRVVLLLFLFLVPSPYNSSNNSSFLFFFCPIPLSLSIVYLRFYLICFLAPVFLSLCVCVLGCRDRVIFRDIKRVGWVDWPSIRLFFCWLEKSRVCQLQLICNGGWFWRREQQERSTQPFRWPEQEA